MQVNLVDLKGEHAKGLDYYRGIAYIESRFI